MTKVCIVGLGLIGGSFAKALKKGGMNILAIDNNPDEIKKALEDNVIDEGESKNNSLMTKADIVIICLYPEDTGKFIINNQECFKKDAVITDASGVKSVVYKDIAGLRDDIDFIGSHPMAGSEEKGYENSDACLFRNCNYIITVTEKNKRENINKITKIAKIVKAGNIIETDPEHHDEMVAIVSHLPHIISYCMKNAAGNEPLRYSGRSFIEMTRIADMNMGLWSQIFMNNNKNILKALDKFKNELDQYRNELGEEKRK